jgi:hypothetical protein
MYLKTFAHANFPATANEIVTAGFKCAPLGCATTTPQKTANAHAAVITIQPEFWPFVLFNTTFATTPLPSSTSVVVPRNSDINGDMRLVMNDE